MKPMKHTCCCKVFKGSHTTHMMNQVLKKNDIAQYRGILPKNEHQYFPYLHTLADVKAA